MRKHSSQQRSKAKGKTWSVAESAEYCTIYIQMEIMLVLVLLPEV